MPAIDDGRRIMAMGLIQFMTSDAISVACRSFFGRNTDSIRIIQDRLLLRSAFRPATGARRQRFRAIENPGVDSRPVRGCRDRPRTDRKGGIASRISPESIMPGSMLVPRPVLRIGWFGFLRTLKQALGRTDAENDADDCAEHEIQQSGIEHSLKGVTHLQYSFAVSSFPWPSFDRTPAPSDGPAVGTMPPMPAVVEPPIGPRTEPSK
jgi:hypothetical protein